MDFMKVGSIVVYGIICALGIPGNALVIWIVGVKMKKTVTTVWYVNLAVADLPCCLIIPIAMADIVMDHYWPYGAAMCNILPAFVGFNMFATVFTLTLISLDRLVLVFWPVWAQNHRSVFAARTLCGLAWFLALLLSLPSLFYRDIMDINNKTVCNYTDNQSAIRASRICRPIFGFLVPLLVIVVCYLLIARRLTVRQFKSRKTLRIMVGVVTAFFICWMPYHTLGLVIAYGKESSVKVGRAVYPLAQALAYINSCLNPVLYVFMGQEFKKRVKVSLHRIFEKAFSEDAPCSSVGSKTQKSQVTASSEAQV